MGGQTKAKRTAASEEKQTKNATQPTNVRRWGVCVCLLLPDLSLLTQKTTNTNGVDAEPKTRRMNPTKTKT